MITFGGVTYFECADSIIAKNLLNLPFVPDCLLGYADGSWPDAVQIAQEFPTKKIFALDVYGNPLIGNGTDSEPGNVNIDGTVNNTKGELARGVILPVVYCPAGWATAMVNAHTAAGVPRSQYLLLTAHYQGPTALGAPLQGMHICGPATCGYGPGSDGCQWQSLPTYDRSILAPNFLQAPSHPGPPSPIPPLRMLVSNYPIIGGPVASVGVRIPVGPTGEGWAVFDGGTNSDPGSASLSPAIPISKFVSITPWVDDPAHDHPDTPIPKVGIQNRGGNVFVKAEGAQAGPSTMVAQIIYNE